MKPYTIQPTPNPNSLKFTATAGVFIESGMLACANRSEASAHPLSASLFAIEGVFNVLVLPPFATITKHPETDWNEILPDVEVILSDHLVH